MREENQITPLISNEEHRKKVKDTYESEVKPFLSENRKAYELYLQNKSSLDLSPAQKASIRCQYPA